MSDLTHRIAAEHRVVGIVQVTGTYECSCGIAVAALPGSGLFDVQVRHVAEVTEAAVREQIAADIEAVLPPSVVTTGPAAYVAGMRDGLHDAARIARGGTA